MCIKQVLSEIVWSSCRLDKSRLRANADKTLRAASTVWKLYHTKDIQQFPVRELQSNVRLFKTALKLYMRHVASMNRKELYNPNTWITHRFHAYIIGFLHL